MTPFLYHRAASFVVMPVIAASSWAGYSYYQDANHYPTQNQYGSSQCVTLSTDLYPGQSANDIAKLQRFLESRGYLSGNPTGYFDQATLTATERFESDQGLPVSGYADANLRARIQSMTCGGNGGYPGYQGGQLSVQGIDAPRQLAVGQSGSWTVHVAGWTNYQGGGSLHYSVVWGDENNGVHAAATYYPSTSVSSSGSFTHTYVTPGTYTPVFTVTDDYGHTTQASATTYVSGTGYGNGNGGYGGNGNSSYCNTSAGWYDRDCDHSGSYGGGYNTYPPATTYPSGNYPSGCTTYYDRNCYVNGQYVGPNFGGNGATYNGPGNTCTYVNGAWQGNCIGSSNTGYNSGSYYNSSSYYYQTSSPYNGYTNTLGGPNGPDYSCYYDRACLASMQGRTY